MSQMLHLYSSSGLFHTIDPVLAEDVEGFVWNKASSITPPATLVILGKSWFPSGEEVIAPAMMEPGDWIPAAPADDVRMNGELAPVSALTISICSSCKKYRSES